MTSNTDPMSHARGSRIRSSEHGELYNIYIHYLPRPCLGITLILGLGLASLAPTSTDLLPSQKVASAGHTRGHGLAAPLCGKGCPAHGCFGPLRRVSPPAHESHGMAGRQHQPSWERPPFVLRGASAPVPSADAVDGTHAACPTQHTCEGVPFDRRGIKNAPVPSGSAAGSAVKLVAGPLRGPSPLVARLRGGRRPDHLPRSFKRSVPLPPSTANWSQISSALQGFGRNPATLIQSPQRGRQPV